MSESKFLGSEFRCDMCDKCAFKGGSKERKGENVARFQKGKFSENSLESLIAAIEPALKGEAPWLPFYCHESLETDCAGNYQPKPMAEMELCAGWMQRVIAAAVKREACE